jgi:hypothetical protein
MDVDGQFGYFLMLNACATILEPLDQFADSVAT